MIRDNNSSNINWRYLFMAKHSTDVLEPYTFTRKQAVLHRKSYLSSNEFAMSGFG